jgi:hypothetical protein
VRRLVVAVCGLDAGSGALGLEAPQRLRSAVLQEAVAVARGAVERLGCIAEGAALVLGHEWRDREEGHPPIAERHAERRVKSQRRVVALERGELAADVVVCVGEVGQGLAAQRHGSVLGDGDALEELAGRGEVGATLFQRGDGTVRAAAQVP